MPERSFADALHEVLTTNQRATAGNRYTVPSPSAYPYQWLWDSCFHAVMYSHLDVEWGKAELRSLFQKQWQSGLVPHMLYWEPNPEIMHVDWGMPDTSTLTQPPLIAYAAWRLYERDGDTGFLRTLYPHLVAFHEYLWRERRLPGRDLIGIINPDESGEDNSPRFDVALGLPPQHAVEDNRDKRFALFDVHKNCQFLANTCTARHFWVEDVPMNVFTILALRAMAAIATELGEDGARWHEQANAIAIAMRTHLFADGSFWSAGGVNASRIGVDTWARFAPLLVGLYTQEEAKTLIAAHFRNPASYARAHTMPTVAANDPSYNPTEPAWGRPWQHPDWRGAIWMLPNWCVYHGLVRYGFTADADRLKTSSAALVAESGFRENYHPETGTGMGAEGFTWSGLIIDMEQSAGPLHTATREDYDRIPG